MRDPILYRIVDAGARTTAPARAGASIRCTTSRTASRTRSRASRTRSARSSSSTTGRSTTGSSTPLEIPRPRPQQIEFARGNLSHTVVSKRVLRRAGRGGARARAGTTRACRRSRACAGAATPPAAIRSFWDEVGVARRDNLIELARLEYAVREELNRSAPRAHGGAAPAARRDRELPGGPRRGARRREQPRGPGRRHAQGALLRASSGSSATTSSRTRRRSSTGSRPAARCGCATRTS